MFWRRRQSLDREIDPEDWQRAIAALPLLEGFADAERQRLRTLAAGFLEKKQLEPAQGATVDVQTRLAIALQAALPVLALGLDWYRGWHALILYPDRFVPAREVMDEDGLVWIDDEPKSGEAWEQGPIILSLADVTAGETRDGYNVVIHELAHKLDLLDGAANGHPPLHRGMSDAAWAQAFRDAYDDLCEQSDALVSEVTAEGEPSHAAANDTASDPLDALVIDPYATESPAEFFAVCSETFFELPTQLRAAYPEVYSQLQAFYRQDPAARLPNAD